MSSACRFRCRFNRTKFHAWVDPPIGEPARLRAGAVLSRYGWLHAGRMSARDPEETRTARGRLIRMLLVRRHMPGHGRTGERARLAVEGIDSRDVNG